MSSRAKVNVNEVVEEAFRQSEKQLESDIALAIAADQRAMAFCGWIIASAALLTGFADRSTSGWSLTVGALFLVVAAALAGYSARPIVMRAPGAKFSDLETDIATDRPLVDVLKEMGGHNDKQSDQNRNILKRNGKLMKLAYGIAVVGLGISSLGQLLPVLCSIVAKL